MSQEEMIRFKRNQAMVVMLTGIALCSSACSNKSDEALTDNGQDVVASSNAAQDVPALPTPIDDANAAAANVEANPPETDLAVYIDKYPFDVVNGTSFLKAPAVVAAVNAAVTDKDIREWILEKAGPQSPIVLKDGKLLAWGCEAHNCGPHNWTIAIDPAGRSADICYFDREIDENRARWFLPGGKTEMREDSCPST